MKKNRKKGSALSAERDASWSSGDPETIERRLASTDLIADFGIAQAVRNLAASYLMSDPSRSLALSKALIQAVQHKRSQVTPEARAMAWRCRAEACLFTGRLKAARRAYEQAIAAAEVGSDQDQLGEILVGCVHLLALMGEAAASERLARRAERLLKRAGNLIYLGKLHMNRGNAFYQGDRFQEAYDAYRKASRVFDRAGSRDATWVGLHMNQAIACTNLSRVEEARRLFLETESHCEQLSLHSLTAHARFNRAFLEGLRGDYRTALSLLEDAGGTFEQQGNRDMVAATQRARAEIYLDLGMPTEARELAGEAADIFAKEGMEFDTVLSQLVIARGFLLSECAPEASPILEAAHLFCRAHRMRPRRTAILLLLAQAELQQGRARQASALSRRALKDFTSLGMHRQVVAARRLLAETLLARGRVEQAEQALGPALVRSRGLPAGERLGIWALAGRISLSLGRRQSAWRRFRLALDHLEAQMRVIPGAEFRARAFERQVRVYHDLVSMALQSPRPRFGSLFRLVEAARGRGFRDRMVGGNSALRRSVKAKRAMLGSMTRRLEEAEYAGKGSSEPGVLRELRRQRRVVEKEIVEQLRRVEGAQPSAPGWRGAPEPERIAALLEPHEALVEYFVVGEQILALVLRKKLRAFRTLPETASAVRAYVDRIRFQLDAMALSPGEPMGNLAFLRGGAEDALACLYRALLDPLMDLLPEAGKLILVPHRFLHSVPFECLYDGKGYIDERYVISRSPTADFLLRRTRKTSRLAPNALVCGVIESGPSSVASEMESVASHFPPTRVRMLKNPTSRQLMEEMPGSQVIHLSMHGHFREDNPLFSRLSTTDGGIFLADVWGTRLSAELVVLSACESGQTYTGRGDELSGVAHGFLAAGAMRLVAAMWRIHDEATEVLMDAFYQNYMAGARRDPASALTQASRAVRESWNHPFYWGSFSVHGD